MTKPKEAIFSKKNRLGAELLSEGVCRFLVWAPSAKKIDVCFESPPGRRIPMTSAGEGYYEATAENVAPGSTYFLELNGQKRPDPASRYQPSTVHGPSEIGDWGFSWSDQEWKGIEIKDYVLYELHVGTFTPEGTFDAIIPRLDDLRDLGITALEIMPVAQFPGNRNWGYDGVLPFAVQNSYGGPQGLKRLVDACHAKGLAVVLDVVYNHLGPEGNYLPEFGPYFTDRYQTPWGMAVNFDGAGSDHVRRFFLENAEMWIGEFHIDALRIDAVHAIYDFSAAPFLRDMSALAAHERQKEGRHIYLIAESDLNDSRLIRPRTQGGCELDAQWNDDFHHALHALLTGERDGYYQDFGSIGHLKKALEEGYVYSGEYSPFRRRRHGNESRDMEPSKFVVFSQNHDQIGNRMRGERLGHLLDFEGQKLAAGLILLSPYVPLLFMGEEYGESAPFQYFISHSDSGLIEAVREGRKKEFESFRRQKNPPDPFDDQTFLNCKLDHRLREQEPHRTLWAFYKRLLQLRKTEPAFRGAQRPSVKAESFGDSLLTLTILHPSATVWMAFNFKKDPQNHSRPHTFSGEKIFDSADTEWRGPGGAFPEKAIPGRSFVVFREKRIFS